MGAEPCAETPEQLHCSMLRTTAACLGHDEPCSVLTPTITFRRSIRCHWLNRGREKRKEKKKPTNKQQKQPKERTSPPVRGKTHYHQKNPNPKKA